MGVEALGPYEALDLVLTDSILFICYLGSACGLRNDTGDLVNSCRKVGFIQSFVLKVECKLTETS